MRPSVFFAAPLLFLSSPLAAGEPAPEPDLTEVNRVERLEYMDQGWDMDERLGSYYRSQGSRIVPYTFLLALHEAGTDKPFARDDLMAKHGLLPQPKDPKHNPDGLPVGLAKDGNLDWVGLACAACHTGQINVDGVGYRVDGGAPMIDYEGFLNELLCSMEWTASSEANLSAFVDRVVGEGAPKRKKQKVRDTWDEVFPRVRDYVANTRTAVKGGPARVDALGGGFNVLTTAYGIQENYQPLIAPVSYPPLWDSAVSDRVQWNGFNHNGGYGRIGRNVGQVLGAWAMVDLKAGRKQVLYPSSVRVAELVDTEQTNLRLRSPRWPEAFGALDQALVERGEQLYAQHCVSCHVVIDPDDPKRKMTSVMVPLEEIGTDPVQATDFAERTAKTGPLEGRRMAWGPETFGPEARAYELLTNVVVGVISAQPGPATEEFIHSLEQGRGTPGGRPVFLTNEELRAYRARSLNGMWATPPFLHNGSVPTLYDLLLPPDQRPKEFWMGSLEFDTRKLGYATEHFDGAWRFDTTLSSNSNAGHTYGTELPDEDRWALLEYLKAL